MFNLASGLRLSYQTHTDRSGGVRFQCICRDRCYPNGRYQKGYVMWCDRGVDEDEFEINLIESEALSTFLLAEVILKLISLHF